MVSLEAEVANVISQLRKKFDENLVALIQIGSSLRPQEMVAESDLDFVIVTKKKTKPFVRVDSHYETNILNYSASEFKWFFAKGEPVPLMAVKFGKPWVGENFLAKLDMSKPTPYTAERWYANGLDVYSHAIMEYFSQSCVFCYLKDCHHAARSLLRAKIVRDKKLLCEADTGILECIDDEQLADDFRKLVNYRKNPPNNDGYWSSKRNLHDRLARPLLVAERIVYKIVKEFEGKLVQKLSNIVAQTNPCNIHTVLLAREKGETDYLVLLDRNKKVGQVRIPFYRP